MALAQIHVLNGSGHLTLEWNPDDEAERARARAEVESLAAAGYTFFLTEEEPADAVAAGRGKLLVKRLSDPVEEMRPQYEAAAREVEEATESPMPRRRGRPAKAPEPAPQQAVAVRPMRGG